MLHKREIYNHDGLMPRLLKAQEVAKILNIGYSTVYQMHSRGEIPGMRIGRSVRFLIEDVENYIASKRTDIEG